MVLEISVHDQVNLMLLGLQWGVRWQCGENTVEQNCGSESGRRGQSPTIPFKGMPWMTWRPLPRPQLWKVLQSPNSTNLGNRGLRGTFKSQTIAISYGLIGWLFYHKLSSLSLATVLLLTSILSNIGTSTNVALFGYSWHDVSFAILTVDPLMSLNLKWIIV
jgi:hypothetical protein